MSEPILIVGLYTLFIAMTYFHEKWMETRSKYSQLLHRINAVLQAPSWDALPPDYWETLENLVSAELEKEAKG